MNPNQLDLLSPPASLAARSGQRFTVAQALAHARLLDAGALATIDGLDAAAWWRLAVFESFSTRLPHLEAAKLPLRVLPESGWAPVNPVQALQALVTLQFAAPGWSRRLNALAALIDDAALRLDFNLFVGAFAPRVLEVPAGADAATLRRAFEQAWADPRVNRRWQHVAVQLGEPGTQELLRRAGRAGLAALAPRRRSVAPSRTAGVLHSGRARRRVSA